MRPHFILVIATLMSAMVQGIPQGLLSIVIGNPQNSFSLPSGIVIPTGLPTTTPANSFPFPRGITIPTDLPITTSKTSPTTTTSSSSSSTSHTTSTTSKTTSSSSSTSKTSSSTPLTTTTPPATPKNPRSAQCPIPSSCTVNSLKSTSGSSGSVSLTITYGGGTFTCPSDEDQENGVFYIDCDPDGLVQLTTDGSSYLYVQEWFWGTAVPHTRQFLDLQSSANATNLGSALSCFTDSNHNLECVQTQTDFVIPVQEYGVGEIIGFELVDLNGVPAANCPTVVDANPIVTTSCSLTPTSASHTGPSTIRTSILVPTVTINWR